MYWILFIGIALVSYLVQANLKRKFEKYSKVRVASGMTGAEAAQKMLRDNGIYDVKVQPHEGGLSARSVLLINVFPTLLLIGIGLFAMSTLFSFVTLPVEIDASKRATRWLQGAGITNYGDQPMAVDALKSAAYTYVVAALSSLATLIYYITIYLSRRD